MLGNVQGLSLLSICIKRYRVMSNDFKLSETDLDSVETQEWKDALNSVIKYEGNERAAFLLHQLYEHARHLQIITPTEQLVTPYLNSISPEQEIRMPDDGQLMTQLCNFMRWNAMAMVMRAGKTDSSLGGHLASYGSIALLYEIGLTYFFHAPNDNHPGDLVYFQGHSSPGIYARAYLEDRLSEAQLDNFRQEIFKPGISSYPHPWLMPNFWQFPTVSMGIGPLTAIYQAHFSRYLDNRKLADLKKRKVWVFCGDGEMGEPESLGALNIASLEKLDNLIFIINCNLQRLDGPVCGNRQIIQEYERVFKGAGWNVIKVIWGSEWDQLFKKDKTGFLLQRLSKLVDGEYQNYCSKDGAYFRKHFFGTSPELLALVENMSDEELKTLEDGGHDPQKVYAAYAAAIKHIGQPTVILVKTIKGYGMGPGGEGLNTTHQTKKMNFEHLEIFAKRFNIPLQQEQISKLHYYKPPKNSESIQYLQKRRKILGGYLPARNVSTEKLHIPELSAFQSLLNDSEHRRFSTTMAFVRILGVLLKDKNIKARIVPIVADEARTFGMEGLFRQIGIYAAHGQSYQPEDYKQLMYYREDQQGQLLQEGLSEAGAMSSWIAAATSYATTKVPMIPFYIYYSMFGFQRVGDLIWSAGDSQARGFIVGGTAGRTTLAGEGLQHQDGHNLLMFSMVPNCVTYDPSFAYELSVIIHDGLKRMYEKQENVFYYVTAMNENYHHPKMPKGVEKDIIKGLYLFQSSRLQSKQLVQLLGSGTILREVIKAAEFLEQEYNIAATVWSATSFTELRKDCELVARYNRLHPTEKAKKSHVTRCLENQTGPVIAATDYMKLCAEQIRQDIKQPYYVLGTDGFGRSDTRKALRNFFEVDANMIAYTALKALKDNGTLTTKELTKAAKKLKISFDRPNPATA